MAIAGQARMLWRPQAGLVGPGPRLRRHPHVAAPMTDRSASTGRAAHAAADEPRRPDPTAPSAGSGAAWAFACFVASGFCGLVYQVVWLRLAMARFGVNAPIASLVLSTFMAGLGLGSVLGGRLAGHAAHRRRSPLALYGVAELVIASSALVVPWWLGWGQALLNGVGEVAWGSGWYFLVSGLWIAAALLPWCVLMGATLPLMMAALQRREGGGGGGGGEGATSFSYLYEANVLGAAVGTLASAYVLIELLGLRGVLRAAAVVNVLIGAASLALARTAVWAPPVPLTILADDAARSAGPRDRRTLALLFLTGAASLALEVVWLRLYLPYLGSAVYVFATVLALYLLASAAGTMRYRGVAAAARRGRPHARWLALALSALLPLLTADPRLPIAAILRPVLGVVPFCYVVGFLTPSLVDRWSGGDPVRAGSAYAVNVLGSIVGPLVAGFVLLPVLGERGAIVAIGVPLFAVGLALAFGAQRAAPGGWRAPAAGGLAIAATAAAAAIGVGTRTFEDTVRAPREIRRDYEATTIAAGEGWGRTLQVNGIGMTVLTPITKMMAHLPLAHLDRPPRDALIIAFGMGTSFRSAMAWHVSTTAVDLVPSVPTLFGFFHADADSLRALPAGRIVIDDGRRFLERTARRFDVIVVDPPPPVEAVGSSLLYSEEFYRVARRRLRPGGILAQWFPGSGEPGMDASVVRPVMAVFPHVRVFRSIEGSGLHILASDRPIPRRSARALARALPPPAARDLVEWGPLAEPEAQFARVLGHELQPAALVADPSALPLSDDRPTNEYFVVRRQLPRLWGLWRTTFLDRAHATGG